MNQFLNEWGEAAYTSLGFFWMALWAFALGYLISSMIQVFVTEKRMQNMMGDKGRKSVLLGTFFGFISSSCSFSALATSKSLFKKGASFVSSIAFLLASTNLVIELGIIISIFLGWQFVVGEYVGGVLLILFSWLLIRIINPKKMIENARKRLDESNEDHADKKSLSENEGAATDQTAPAPLRPATASAPCAAACGVASARTAASMTLAETSELGHLDLVWLWWCVPCLC